MLKYPYPVTIHTIVAPMPAWTREPSLSKPLAPSDLTCPTTLPPTPPPPHFSCAQTTPAWPCELISFLYNSALDSHHLPDPCHYVPHEEPHYFPVTLMQPNSEPWLTPSCPRHWLSCWQDPLNFKLDLSMYLLNSSECWKPLALTLWNNSDFEYTHYRMFYITYSPLCS